jgi:serine-type D-Ala-D-Ala endopeptidase (penicillin-binding protein 7)
VVIVLLDSFGKYTRVADARRIRKWLEARPPERALPRAA